MTRYLSCSFLARLLVTAALAGAVLLLTAGDWPTYLHDPQRSSSNPSETILSPTNATRLVQKWAFTTGGYIESSPIVVGNTVYVGSWDGYEYALDATTGALKWKRYLGITNVQGCNPQIAGVSSSATVQNGVLYVGGGRGFWYALSANTGAVLWGVYTGFGVQGHYNWSSPLIYNGYAYIDMASYGDCPLVQGVMLQVSLATHHVTHIFQVVPHGQTGGGLWSSPAVDPATNTIYVTSGNEGQEPPTSQPYTMALVALDAATLAVKGSWQIPSSQDYGDSDFGATPTLFTDAQGRQLVGAANKNGIFYAFDRTNVSNGPVWQQGTSGLILGATVYANGLLIDAAGPDVEVRNAATGTLLVSLPTGNQLYASPSIANGQIFEGSTDGKVYAFGLG